MPVRLLDRFTLADGAGAEYDIGELVTWLNDAVLIAPSMLLVPGILWVPVDADSFDVSVTDQDRTVIGRVSIDHNRAPKNFSTTDRFCYNPDEPTQLIRARWTTPVAGWQVADNRPLLAGAQAIWHLAQGRFVYADFKPVPETLEFNVPSA